VMIEEGKYISVKSAPCLWPSSLTPSILEAEEMPLLPEVPLNLSNNIPIKKPLQPTRQKSSTVVHKRVLSGKISEGLSVGTLASLPNEPKQSFKDSRLALSAKENFIRGTQKKEKDKKKKNRNFDHLFEDGNVGIAIMACSCLLHTVSGNIEDRRFWG